MRPISKNCNAKRKKNTGGFTTIEQIIVIILVLILSSGLVFGIMKWVEWTDFKRQNEYARTLFTAAQNQLTEYSESGQLAALQEKVTDGEGNYIKEVDVTELYGKDGEKYDLNSVWPESSNKGESAFRYRGEVCSIIGTPEDYKAYLAGDASEGKEALYDMFSSYLYDTSILNAVVCVEFTPEDGQVFAVLYSDKNEGFTYEDTSERRGTVSISSRKTDYRKRRMVGYYGVDMLSKATSTKVEKPSISEVRLNNEDTLNLTFRLSKVKEAAQELRYELTINDKDTKSPLLRFTLDGTGIGNENHKKAVSCEVTRYSYNDKGESKSVKIGEYNVPVWIDKEQTIHVILDAADLDATSYLYSEVYKTLAGDKLSDLDVKVKEIKNTLSFLRFGAEAEDIYCTIQGSGKYYKTTAKKQSNSENTYFGSAKIVKEDGKTTSVTYSVKNARHLYNMRYLEDFTDKERTDMGYDREPEQIVYQISEDIDWEEFQENEALYQSGAETRSGSNAKAAVKDQAFPSLKQLRSDAVLESAGNNKVYTISSLKITDEANDEASLYEFEQSLKAKSAGLVLENNGTMQNLALDKIVVEGENSVGAFCGRDNHVLKNLTVKNTDSESIIKGNFYVGAIAGIKELDGKDSRAVYEGLTNYAKVTGKDERMASSYFGGVIGILKAENESSITVRECKNYGQIEAINENMEGLGGIIGYCEAKSGTILIEDCLSSPQYLNSEIKEILSSRQNLEKRLKGTYVGGIIGRNTGADIVNCNTEKEESSKEGYIFGEKYVGGIVGYNDPQSSTSAVIKGGDDSKKGVNAAHVLGKEYVGGIVGTNPKEGEITNWINRGFVAATDVFTGGITGYNGDTERDAAGSNAVISNCSSEVVNSTAVRTLSGSELFNANYVGGIAGYNGGEITSDSEISLVCNVTGNNYVGGVTGYNDVDAVVSNYAVAGGYVNGNGSFVGGFAGVNTSRYLLMTLDGAPRFLKSNPNQVTGSYCVGGTIGGNIVPSSQNINAGFFTDNFLGELTAKKAIAGGFIGYNRLVMGNTDRKDILSAVQQSIRALDAAGDISNLANPQNLFGNLSESGSTLTISGRGSQSTQAKFGGITASIHVGGVMGYNDPNTSLRIENVVNKTPVTALDSVEYNAEQPGKTTYQSQAFRYSYAGGIIGKVHSKVTLYNCSNQDAGDVVTKGTYTGGLSEINEGQITCCAVSSIGSGSMDYVGGLVGINKSGGRIDASSMAGRTVTGRNYVGGITAENYGNISDTAVNMGNLRAYGTNGVVGGIAGYNYDGAVISLSGTMNIAVRGDGNYIGGVTGINEGAVTQTNASVTAVRGSVTGNRYVGGIIGSNRRDVMKGFRNAASVTAVNGVAGGIAGESSADIIQCYNNGTVVAQQSGNAGGIVADNNRVIKYCENYGNISAQNGIGGGISGQNAQGAVIEGCKVKAVSDIGYIVFESKDKAGGVSGINHGVIKDTSVDSVQIYNLSGSQNSMMGGITAENTSTGEIAECNVGANHAISLTSRASQTDMGGVTGVNSGKIEGTTEKYSKVNARLSMGSSAFFGNIGGIAGRNTSTVSWYEFTGTVSGTSNNPQNAPTYDPNADYETAGAVIYGYGGIAGVNGNSGAVSTGTITNCKVNQARITGTGDANNIANIGGIAGVNGLGASIANVSFGSGEQYTVNFSGQLVKKEKQKASVYVGTGSDSTAYGHTGGVAGLNSGSISDIGYARTEAEDDREDTSDFDISADEGSVIVENYRGHVGGIAGYNRRTGTIINVSTGKNWVVYAPQNAQDNGCGGIIGYQAGETGLSYCTNRAVVEKSAANSNGVGGMIGRMECATSRSYTIRHCKNYGDIYGAARAGGMIGVWKYYGGTLSDCVNYGNITGGSQGAGGIVGCFYDVKEAFGAVTIQRCENHGRIQGNYSGGIAAYASQNDVVVHLKKCVNTGLVAPGENSGGILGITSSISANSSIIGCNNYGYGYNSSNIGGIVASNLKKNITIRDCFGLADTKYPIGSNLSNTNERENYYLDETDEEIERKFYITSIKAIGINEAAQLYKVVLKADEEGLADTARAYFTTDKIKNSSHTDEDTAAYEFTFSREMSLSAMDLYWNRDGNARVQNYKVQYKTLLDDEWKDYETVENTTRPDRDSMGSLEKISKGTVTARQVRIVIKESVGVNNAKVNACLIRINFYETVEGKTKKYYQGTAAEGYKYTSDSTGIVQYTLEEEPDDTAKGIGNTAFVQKNQKGYYLVSKTGMQIGFAGFTRNPLEEFNGANNEKNDTDLAATGSVSNNIRYQVFEADNPYFNADAAADGSITLNMPEGVKLADGESGAYKAQWNSVTNAAYYQYEAVYYDADGTQIGETKRDIIYDTSVMIPVTDINGIAVDKVTFKVRAGADTKDADGRIKAVWSSYSEEVEKKAEDTLPVPQYHLELVINANNEFNYQAFLDNQEEYRAFLEKHQVAAEDMENALDKITITIGIGNNASVFTFTAKDGKSSSQKYYAGNDTNAMYKASAKADGYMSSAEYLRESVAFTNDTYISSEKLALVLLTAADTEDSRLKNIGFQGATKDTLSYQVRIRYANSRAFYMRSELMAVDKELGVPVAVATSELRVSDTTSDYIPTSLSHLPAELMNEQAYSDLTVRSYPSMMSNSIVYNGHTVDVSAYTQEGKKGIEKDLLTSLYVTEDNQLTDNADGSQPLIRKVDGKSELVKGFVVELASDGTYTLYYNTLLAFNNDKSYESASVTKMKTQVFYYKLPEDRDVQESPVIHVNDKEQNGQDGNPDEDRMLITWDLNKAGYENSQGGFNYKDGAVYDYLITGTTSEEAVIQIATGEYVTGEDGENQLELETDAWNYKWIAITISRRGEMNSQGMTTIFPSGNIWESALKLRLSQITKPDVTLHREEGVVQKNTLIYDVTWNSVPEAERSELGAYEVSVSRDESDTAAIYDYGTKEEYEEALEKQKTFYAGKPGVKITDNSDGQAITYEWEEEAADGTVRKTMVLSLEKNESEGIYKITKNLKAVWNFPVGEDSSEEMVRMIDLNDYERGERLNISVCALAAADASVYRDGQKGVVSEMILPSRLDVPDVSVMSSSPEYASDSFITLEQLEDGLTLSYEPENTSGEVQGRYQIAAAIYDDCAADTSDDSKIENAGDSKDGQSGYWNSGAVVTVLGKEEAVEMDGNLLSAEYILKNTSAEYAGKWLKIAMRSISESNVSSYWSDEDESVEETVNYRWIRIPRVQTATPDINQDQETHYYDEDGKLTDSPGDTDLPITQTRLSFEETGQTDSYQIQLIRSATADVDITDKFKYVVQYADWIYLEKAEESRYYVFYATSNPGFNPEPYRKAATADTPVSQLDSTSVYLGAIDSEGRIMLPYTGEVAESAADNAAKIPTVAYIQSVTEGNERTFILQLPDAEKVNGLDSYGGKEDLFTAQVTVQGRITKERQTAYENSKVADWYRKNDGTAAITELDEYMALPENIHIDRIVASERENTAYEISASARNWLVYQIEIFDEVSNSLHQGYVSAYGYGTSDISTVALLEKALYAEPAGASARIRVAAIVEGKTEEGANQGGLSQWSDWMPIVSLPQLADALETTEPSSHTLAPAEAGNDAHQGSIEVPMLSQTWTKEDADSYYTIEIDGQLFSTENLAPGSYVLLTLEAGEGLSVTADVTLEVGKSESGQQYTLTYPQQSFEVTIEGKVTRITFNSEPEILAVN